MIFTPEIYTYKVLESQRFYTEYLGFNVKQATEGYVLLQHNEKRDYQLIFCVPDSPFIDPIYRHEFKGKGVLFQIEVPDVKTEYERIKRLKIPIALELIQEEFNGTHFTIIDPNGIFIDFVTFDSKT